MQYFLASLGFFSLFIILMGLGVIISNKRLQGSCGGVGKIFDDASASCPYCKDDEKLMKEECKIILKNNSI